MFTMLFKTMNMITDNGNMNMIVSNEYDFVETTYCYTIILCLVLVCFLKLYTSKNQIIHELTKDIECKEDTIQELHEQIHLFTKEAEEIAVKKLEYDTKREEE